MLISSESAHDIVLKYANFVQSFVQTQWVIKSRYFGTKSMEVYQQAITELKNGYEGLNVEKYEPFDSMIEEAETVIAKGLSAEQKNAPQSKQDSSIRKILDRLSLQLDVFEYRHAEEFREKAVAQMIGLHEVYLLDSYQLHGEVRPIMDIGKYDSAVVSAFKFLDSHIQKSLKVSPTEYYGEELINYAFKPESGKLQLNTHPNEQIGLRNLVSGANALFRNPSAHRFRKFDKVTANVIIALIAMIAKLVTQLATENKPKRKRTTKKAE